MAYGGIYWAIAHCSKCGYIKQGQEDQIYNDTRGVPRHKYNNKGRRCNNPLSFKPNQAKAERSKQRSIQKRRAS